MTSHMKVIIPAYNCSEYIEKCLDSIKSQAYDNWQAIVIDDVSTDDTTQKIDKMIRGDNRFVFVQNTKRVLALANIVKGIQKADCKDEDVIVLVDGDDWLATPDVLSIVARTYEDPEVWLTYGTFKRVPGDVVDKVARPTPPGHDPRHGTYFWRHLRTYKYFLWKNLKDEDLRFSETGEYFPAGYDVAIMRPLVEIATHKHVKYIDEILYIYNRGNPLCDGNVNRSLQARCGAEVYWRQSYPPMTKAELIEGIDKRSMMEDQHKPKVLLIVDILGWTFHQIALQLKMRLSCKYDFTIVTTDDLAHTDSKKFDVVYLLGAYTGKSLTFGLPVKKTILGIRADYYLPDDRTKLIDFCNEKLKSRGSYFTLVNHNQYKKLDGLVDNLNVIPDGVDLNIFNYKKYANKRPNHSKLVVGYAGSSRGFKGVGLIDQACKMIGAIFISALQKVDRTHLTMKEMPGFYNKLDVYACLSESEGLCLPILEAGAMGIPVVSTRVGVANEIIKHGENGFLVDRNPTDLSKHLKLLEEDVELRGGFGRNLREEIIHNWGWASVIGKFDNLFQKVIRENG